MNLRHSALFPATLGLLLGASFAVADPVTFTASGLNSGNRAISASATFDTTTPGVLKITVENTRSDAFHIGGADVLTAVYFDIGSGATLAPVSAGLGSLSEMLPNSASETAIPSHWGYFSAPSILTGAASGSMAVSATGLIAGSNVDFTGVSHGSSGYLAGPAYGIVGSTGDTFRGIGLTPLEANSVVFQLDYTGTIHSVNSVSFVYGTSSGEGLIPSSPRQVPDSGATLGLALLGLGALGWIRRKFRA